jgi:ABC-type transporter MlaC component
MMGDIIYYQIAKDNRGKYKAINAQIEGLNIAEDKSRDALQTSLGKQWIIVTTVAVAIIIIAAAVSCRFWF